MDVVINLDKVMAVLALPPDILLARIFLYVGWVPIAIFLLWVFKETWIYYIQLDYARKREFILLAIDVPQENEQTPRAVEHMFAHLAGAHASINLIEKYWNGKLQDRFSLEIVSIEGYTQYLIRTMPKYRDLVETMIYAQYPGAEITEVNDYVEGYPAKFPDEIYNIHGAEWILQRPSVYPLRTYLDFEHQFSGEFIDPNSALLELFGNLRKGEQCWYQIVVTPRGFDWEQEGYDEISKVIGEKKKNKENIFDKLTNGFLNILTVFSEFIVPLWGDIENKKEEEKEISMLNLRPVQKKQIEAIQQKISKVGFDVKIRFIYIAEKEVFDKARFGSFVGVMKQYNFSDLNGLKPDMDITATSTHYLWKESRVNARKKRLMSAYKSRDNWEGRKSYILNIEELATLWHFPIEEAVQAPMLQKVTSRKSEAPSYLPIEGAVSDLGSEINLPAELINASEEKEAIFSPVKSAPRADMKKSEPPANLPVG